MPPSLSTAQALPGNSSGSRKRTHAEITRSESRSQSPQPPLKRRRTILTPTSSRTSSSPESASNSTVDRRLAGGGFDFRRPIMSTSSLSQAPNQNTIDLTLEDDSPPPRPTPVTSAPQYPAFHPDMPIQSITMNPPARAPPFVPNIDTQNQPVIDLSSDDEDDATREVEHGTPLASSSPDIQFMGERAISRPASRNNPARRRRHLPTPPGMGNLVNFVRDMTQNYFVNLRGAREPPEAALNRIDGLLNNPAFGPGGMNPPADRFTDEYDGLQMDYGRTGFNIGGDFLVIEEPVYQPMGVNRPNDPTYKEPAPVKEGFTRNYGEDDMLICAFCLDELATGKTEQKQQVWIIKQCGHAYCGDCANSRIISKNKNNKDSKRIASKKTNGFKVCAVPTCRKAVDSKTKMFQIYL